MSNIELKFLSGIRRNYTRRTRDASMAEAWDGLMPRDNPRDTRFAINFFTSIGLGALTEDLRAHLKNAPKPVAVVAPMTRGKC